jgi:pyridoxamine 5'-phosphate oxidase
VDFTPLREQDADRDPHRQFSAWFAQAQRAGERAPEAGALATATPEGAPSVRMVLVKGYGPAGYLFYSNYESRKASELVRNPRAALLFHWDLLGRQIRLEGAVQRLSAEESAAYVRGRPRGSQLSALASPQSRPVADREVLEQRVAELTATYEGADLPVPGHWGGFRLLAERIEFWQHRQDRLHDRLLYTREADGWTIARLAP